jgi:hypothetical protein
MIGRSLSHLLCLMALVLWSAAAPALLNAQISSGSFNPYADPLPASAGDVVLPDADNAADPAGNLAATFALDNNGAAATASFVATSGGHFWADGQPFRHVGVNEVDFAYEGGDVWNDTYYLRQAGVKQVRLILANDALSTATIINDLDAALGVAWSRGIRVTVSLTNFYYGTHYGSTSGNGHTAVAGDGGYYTDTCCGGIRLLNHAWIAGGYNVNYKPFVQAVVSHFQNDGRIFAWEIGNEIGAPNGDVTAFVNFYKDMARTIKGIDHNHLVAPGIICTSWVPLNSAQATDFYQSMDYVTEHHYDPNSPNPGDLNDGVYAASLGKPLVIEEYGTSQVQYPYSSDHTLIMPNVSDFFDRYYASSAPYKQADAIMVWGVDFPNDLGSGDSQYGPREQGLLNDYLQLWRESADWMRPSPRYSDVPPGDTFYTYIECLSARRAVNGLFGWVDDANNNQFRPGDPVTRAQAVKAIVRAMGWSLAFPTTPTFTDVPRTSPFYRYVETAVSHGIISGYADHTFHPDANLTRGQMCKVIVLAGGFPINTAGGPHFVDVPTTQTFYPFVETAFNRGIVSGYGAYFYPDNTTTRGQFAKMLSQAISCN